MVNGSTYDTLDNATGVWGKQHFCRLWFFLDHMQDYTELH